MHLRTPVKRFSRLPVRRVLSIGCWKLARGLPSTPSPNPLLPFAPWRLGEKLGCLKKWRATAQSSPRQGTAEHEPPHSRQTVLSIVRPEVLSIRCWKLAKRPTINSLPTPLLPFCVLAPWRENDQSWRLAYCSYGVARSFFAATSASRSTRRAFL
ncbi:hypothetical protein VN12_21470 [Pirellula sp. SH-Sr6A]|nr:hypothetical protein VN12_21470 [Pirellula sp. SH-Sr6A]